MQGILTRVAGGKAMRTDFIQGTFTHYPKVGAQFAIVGEALTPGATGRLVTTSRVVETEDDPNTRTRLFETESGSKYMLTLLDD